MENWNEPRIDEAQKPTRFIVIPQPLQKPDAVRRIAIPPQVVWVLESLSQAGFLGFLVGGCVRDACLGKPPADWDLATSATPEQVIRRFCHGENAAAPGHLGASPWGQSPNPPSVHSLLGASPWGRLRVIPTGPVHGTVTLVFEGQPSAEAAPSAGLPAPGAAASPAPYAGVPALGAELPLSVELTTFRTEGTYSDHRHPDQVSFSCSLEDDLSRRDFTINAMAWDLQEGSLVDPYGGLQDLQQRRICCVGNPAKRFQEDGLRILRALRFASALGFSVEEQTAAALFAEKEILRTTAPERIRAELEKLLLGAGAEDVLQVYWPVLAVVLPEIKSLAARREREAPSQGSAAPGDCAWRRGMRALCETPASPVLRWAMFLYELGKEQENAQGRGETCLQTGYAQGRDETSLQTGDAQGRCALCLSVMERLRFSGAMRDRICRLVQYRDADLPSDTRGTRRWLHRLGEEELRLLIACKAAHCRARGPEGAEDLACLARTEASIEAIRREGLCYRLPDLAVDGNDLLALGLSGPAVGLCLDALLKDVMDDLLPNDRDVLLAAAQAKLAGVQV